MHSRKNIRKNNPMTTMLSPSVQSKFNAIKVSFETLLKDYSLQNNLPTLGDRFKKIIGELEKLEYKGNTEIFQLYVRVSISFIHYLPPASIKREQIKKISKFFQKVHLEFQPHMISDEAKEFILTIVSTVREQSRLFTPDDVREIGNQLSMYIGGWNDNYIKLKFAHHCATLGASQGVSKFEDVFKEIQKKYQAEKNKSTDFELDYILSSLNVFEFRMAVVFKTIITRKGIKNSNNNVQNLNPKLIFDSNNKTDKLEFVKLCSEKHTELVTIIQNLSRIPKEVCHPKFNDFLKVFLKLCSNFEYLEWLKIYNLTGLSDIERKSIADIIIQTEKILTELNRIMQQHRSSVTPDLIAALTFLVISFQSTSTQIQNERKDKDEKQTLNNLKLLKELEEEEKSKRPFSPVTKLNYDEFISDDESSEEIVLPPAKKLHKENKYSQEINVLAKEAEAIRTEIRKRIDTVKNMNAGDEKEFSIQSIQPIDFRILQENFFKTANILLDKEDLDKEFKHAISFSMYEIANAIQQLRNAVAHFEQAHVKRDKKQIQEDNITPQNAQNDSTNNPAAQLLLDCDKEIIKDIVIANPDIFAQIKPFFNNFTPGEIYLIGGAVIHLCNPAFPLNDLDWVTVATKKTLLCEHQFHECTYRRNLYQKKSDGFSIDVTSIGKGDNEDWINAYLRSHADLTISALVCGPDGLIYDPTRMGLKDLKEGRLRTIRPAEETLKDPKVIFRIFKYLSRNLGFFCDPELEAAIRAWQPDNSIMKALLGMGMRVMNKENKELYIDNLQKYNLLEKLFGISYTHNALKTWEILEEKYEMKNKSENSQHKHGFFKEKTAGSAYEKKSEDNLEYTTTTL